MAGPQQLQPRAVITVQPIGARSLSHTSLDDPVTPSSTRPISASSYAGGSVAATTVAPPSSLVDAEPTRRVSGGFFGIPMFPVTTSSSAATPGPAATADSMPISAPTLAVTLDTHDDIHSSIAPIQVDSEAAAIDWHAPVASSSTHRISSHSHSHSPSSGDDGSPAASDAGRVSGNVAPDSSMHLPGMVGAASPVAADQNSLHSSLG